MIEYSLSDTVPLSPGQTRPGVLTEGQVVGLSKGRRSLFSLLRGRNGAPLKLLILSGQHGDERPAQKTVESFLAKPAEELARRLRHTQAAVIPEVNPDGCAARTRYNADGIDLNRDHQLLRSGEVAAVHRFVRQWQPQVVLDLHSYPSRRRHLLERNVVLNHDVFLDVPSHPAILVRPGIVDGRDVLRELLRELTGQGIRAERYTIVEASGRARHSTPDVVDARNGLALRYGAFTILVENRQPRRDETSTERSRLRVAQQTALWTIVEWLDRNHDLFPSWLTAQAPEPGWPVPVRVKYKRHGQGLNLTCRDAVQGRSVSVTFSRYCSGVVPRRMVNLPAGYAVPAQLETLQLVLRRHGFVSTRCRAGDARLVEKLRIEAARPGSRPDKSPRKLVLSSHPMSLELDRYEVFPTRQNGGEALAVFLEPESQYGLHRFSDTRIPLAPLSWYPVLRVLEGNAPTTNGTGAARPPEPYDFVPND